MSDLNSILLEGNVVREPDIRTTAKGTPVCFFTIASNCVYKKDSEMEKEAGFFDVETWGKLAEVCSPRIREGRGVRVIGKLKQNSWTDSDGKKHSKISIVAENIELKQGQKREVPKEPAAGGYGR